MTVTVRTRTIAAKPQAVWYVLADFGAISGWAANVDHSCILEHPAGGGVVGTSRRIQSGRTVVVERVVDHVPVTSLTYDIEGLPTRLKTVRNRWWLEPQGDHDTVVTLTTTVEIGPRPPHELAERVVARLLAKQSDTMLAGLAAHLEHPIPETRHG